MAKALIYTTATCPYCRLAKQLLTELGVEIEEIRVDLDPAKRQEMVERTGRLTVPQIFIDGHFIGGYRELLKLYQSGRLRELLRP